MTPPPAEIVLTARSIAEVQSPSGAIGWPDGHVDPWDHVECAMALSACGLTRQARRAYQWLRDTQRADGSWPRAIQDGVITDHAAESHHAAYAAVGAWHEFLVTRDRGFAAQLWPMVRDAIGWVLDLQTLRGEVAWERDASGEPGAFALLSGCSSILHGLRCGIALADLAGEPQPDWELAAVQLGTRTRPASGGVRGQEPVRDGLVLPGDRRRRPRDRRREPAGRRLGHVRGAGPGRALRQRPAMGDGSRDLRARARARHLRPD